MEVLGFGFRHEFARPDAKMCFLSCGSQGLDLAEARDGEIHGGFEMNHMALRIAEGTIEEIVEELARSDLHRSVSHTTRTRSSSWTPTATESSSSRFPRSSR
jgi:hypothetical protein